MKGNKGGRKVRRGGKEKGKQIKKTTGRQTDKQTKRTETKRATNGRLVHDAPFSFFNPTAGFPGCNPTP